MQPGNTDHCPRMAPTPGCSFRARVAFTFGDRQFQPLDPFPYAELGMTEGAAWNFWRSAMIEVSPPIDVLAEVPVITADAPTAPAAPAAPPAKRHKRW